MIMGDPLFYSLVKFFVFTPCFYGIMTTFFYGCMNGHHVLISISIFAKVNQCFHVFLACPFPPVFKGG